MVSKKCELKIDMEKAEVFNEFFVSVFNDRCSLIYSSMTETEIELIFNKCANDMKLSSAVDTLEGRDAIQGGPGQA
ncbi:hypothetical protein BTVI_37422 [Pitangus sulphuratus]|nr:hypothetical protein BTVI_37422 [Pitangus sulphuratus]